MIQLKKSDYEKIVAHARANLPEEDKRLAYDSTVNYLILSLMNADEPVLKAFAIDKNREVTVEEISIIG